MFLRAARHLLDSAPDRPELGGSIIPYVIRAARRARYADNRVRAIDRGVSPALGECGEPGGVWLECGCHRTRVRRQCRQRLVCEECRHRWSKRTARRVADALRARLAEAHAAYQGPRGKGPLLVFATFTPPGHSGDVLTDRRRIEAGLKAVRKWVHAVTGQRYHYALAWEATPGRDGKGHVHAHAAIVQPVWLDWRKLRAVYDRAVGHGGGRVDLQRVRKGVGGASNYLAKYMSKGVESGAFTDEKRGEVLAAFYARRGISTSHRFYLVAEHGCPWCGCGRVRVAASGPLHWHWRAHGGAAELRAYDPDLAVQVAARLGLPHGNVGGSRYGPGERSEGAAPERG